MEFVILKTIAKTKYIDTFSMLNVFASIWLFYEVYIDHCYTYKYLHSIFNYMVDIKQFLNNI